MAEVIRSKRKTIAVQIKPDGAVVVRAPKWMRDQDIENFLQEKHAWIEKHRAAMQERQALLKDVIDSVVVHELCHRKQMNHSAAFYNEVERVYPEYKQCDKWLRENGSMYLSRLP